MATSYSSSWAGYGAAAELYSFGAGVTTTVGSVTTTTTQVSTITWVSSSLGFETAVWGTAVLTETAVAGTWAGASAAAAPTALGGLLTILTGYKAAEHLFVIPADRCDPEVFCVGREAGGRCTSCSEGAFFNVDDGTCCSCPPGHYLSSPNKEEGHVLDVCTM